MLTLQEYVLPLLSVAIPNSSSVSERVVSITAPWAEQMRMAFLGRVQTGAFSLDENAWADHHDRLSVERIGQCGNCKDHTRHSGRFRSSASMSRELSQFFMSQFFY
jgi:hypothetical protein